MSGSVKAPWPRKRSDICAYLASLGIDAVSDPRIKLAQAEVESERYRQRYTLESILLARANTTRNAAAALRTSPRTGVLGWRVELDLRRARRREDELWLLLWENPPDQLTLQETDPERIRTTCPEYEDAYRKLWQERPAQGGKRTLKNQKAAALIDALTLQGIKLPQAGLVAIHLRYLDVSAAMLQERPRIVDNLKKLLRDRRRAESLDASAAREIPRRIAEPPLTVRLPRLRQRSD